MEEQADKRQPPAFGELPWLVNTHGNSKYKQVQTFYSISTSPNGTKAYLRSIPQLRGKEILLSQHGWLLLRDQNELSILSLFNLETSQTINLPQLPPAFNVRRYACALSMSPDSDACVLLLCSNENGLMVFCRPAQPDCSWVTQTLELDILIVVSLNGVLYGTTASDTVFYIEDNLKSLTIMPLQIPEPFFDFDHDAHTGVLLESCGCVYKVRLYFALQSPRVPRIIAVKVWELDLQEKIWVDVTCLNGRAFFINHGGSTWCWGTTKSLESSIGCIEGNCIYFHISTLPEPLYLYNLLDQTWTTLSPGLKLVSPGDCSFWVIPQQLQQKRLLASEECEESTRKVDTPNQRVCHVECQESSLNKETQENILSKLPFHMIELISNYMHLFDYWNFCASCKKLSSELYALYRKTNSDPLFMIFKDHGKLCTIMDPFRHDSRSSNILPLPLDSLTLEFCKNGWLLYLIGTRSLKFVNVLTKVRGGFPSLPPHVEGDIHCQHYKSIAFSTYPTCSDCLTVAIYDNIESVDFCYLRSGDEAWNICYFYHKGYTFEPSSSTPVFLEGAFYFIDNNGYLGEFTLVDGHPSWQVFDRPEIEDQRFCLNCLVTCNGKLYSVFIGEMGMWVQVFWFNHSEKYWVEIDHMENRILFISRKSSYSVITSDRKMGNKIFLPWLSEKNIIYYSLISEKFHIHDRDDAIEDLYGMIEPQLCCWF